MIPVDGRLALGLLAGLALTQAAAWLLARGLGLRLRPRVMACGIAAPLLLLAPWLGGRRLLAPTDVLRGSLPGFPQLAHPDPHDLENDAVFQFLPWELEIRHAFAAHRLPLWSDLLEGGSSPWANPQAAALSPAAFAGRLLPIQHHLLGALAAKILLALEGAYLLARLLGASRRASLLAGAGFALGGGIVAWGIFPHSAAAAWVPWLAAGTIRLLRRPGAAAVPRTIVATALVTAALLLSGHPETAAIGGLFAAVCGLGYRKARKARKPRKPPTQQTPQIAGRGLLSGLAAAGAAAALGFGFAAPLLLPFLALLPSSTRAQEALGLRLPAAAAVGLADPRTWFYLGRWQMALTPLNPFAWGRPFHAPFTGPVDWLNAASGYTGVVALAGAALALAGGRGRARRAAPLLAFAAVSLLLAAKFIPFAAAVDAVRPLRALTLERFLPVGSLALAVAGGLGLDAVFFSHRARRAAIWIALAAAAIASLALGPLWPAAGLWALVAAAIALAESSVGPAWRRHAGSEGRLNAGRSWRRPAATALLFAALLLDLVPWSRDLLPAGDPGLFYPRTPFVAEMRRLAGPAAGAGAFRAMGALFLAYPSMLPFYGMAEPRPHNPLAPAAYLAVLGDAFDYSPSMSHYFSSFDHVDHPLLRFLNVRAVVASVELPPSRRLVLVSGERYAPFFLYENPGALPRWFVPGSAVVIGRSGVRGFLAALDDPARVALFADETRGFQPAGLTGAARALPVLAARPGRTVLALPPGTTLVATSIPRVAGWRARADGRETAILTVDGAFLGVRVPAGARRLTLSYRPPGLVAGTAAAAASAVLSVALLAAASRRRRRGLGGGRNRRPALFSPA